MKLQVMESFHCSSSSLDALNSFNKKPINIFLLAEGEAVKNDQFPSPKLKALEVTGEGYHRKRHHTDTGTLSLSPEADTLQLNQSSTATRRKSLFTSLSRLRVPSFIANNKKQQKPGIFSRLMNKFRSHFKRSETKRQQPVDALSIKKSSSSTTAEEPLQLSYEQIISGQIPLGQVSLEHIEVNKQSIIKSFLTFPIRTISNGMIVLMY